MQNITAMFRMVVFLACFFFYEENEKYVANNISISINCHDVPTLYSHSAFRISSTLCVFT